MLKRKEITEAKNTDLIDWLCYACWWEYDRACKQSETARKQKEKEIAWMEAELEKRTANWRSK